MYVADVITHHTLPAGEVMTDNAYKKLAAAILNWPSLAILILPGTVMQTISPE